MGHKNTSTNTGSDPNPWLPRVDTASAVPLYEQVIEQAALAVAAGHLTPGAALPSVRTLAAELRINPNTAARAVRELERAGLSRPLRGVGSVVAKSAGRRAGKIARLALEREVAATVGVARQLGLGLDEVLAQLRTFWKEDGHVD